MRVSELRERYVIPVEQIDTTRVLLEAVQQARAMSATWQHVVDELQAGEGGLWSSDDSGVARVHEAAKELRLAIREHAQVAKWAAEAGIEERQIRVAEEQGALLAEVVGRILDGLLGALLEAGLPAEAVHRVFDVRAREVVRGELLAVAERGEGLA